jgi:hypothetical protein
MDSYNKVSDTVVETKTEASIIENKADLENQKIILEKRLEIINNKLSVFR